MSVKKSISSALGELKFNFRHAHTNDIVYKFFEPDSLPVNTRQLEDFALDCKKNKISCIIPCLSNIHEVTGSSLAQIIEFYEELLDIAEKKELRVGFAVDRYLEDCFFSEFSPVPEDVKRSLSSKILNQREYYCVVGEEVSMDFSGNTLMAISLFDADNMEYTDIRDRLCDSKLSFVPDEGGNRIVNAYTCDCENVLTPQPRRSFNKLRYDTSMKFLTMCLDLMGEKVRSHIGKTLSLLYINDICFDSPNRRNWDDSFNENFIRMHNFSPEPYYNCLYSNIGEKTVHMKTLFMACRAQMLREGAFWAFADFAKKYGLELVNTMTEPKLADCSWLTGDALSNYHYSSCALLDKAYMYGINSLTLASSAAQNFGLDNVYCEIYGDYYTISPKIMFKDMINAYSKGCNRLLVHTPANIDYENGDMFNRKRLLALSARCRSLLCEGTQVSDIAILYPSASMHSEIYLYQCKTDTFEYPNILPYNDHMTVINMLSYFCGQDTILIHPEVMDFSCRVCGDKIRMDTAAGINNFGVLILPGMSVINIQNLRLIKEFYDNGGKIIATGRLPYYAAEYHPDHEKPVDENDFMHLEAYGTVYDTEVRETVAHIFGSETTIQSQLREYYHNKNSNGGEAYFLCASKTTSDGTLFCDENLLKRILYSLKIPFDVYMSNLPDQMGYDSLNDIYPNFSRMGFDVAFPGGGMVNHIHKKRSDVDIYFFSNTTDKKYNGYVFLKGAHCPTCLDPSTGKRSSASYKYVNFNGEVYTALRLSLDASQCVFVLSHKDKAPHIKIQSLPKIKSIEHNFLTE